MEITLTKVLSPGLPMASSAGLIKKVSCVITTAPVMILRAFEAGRYSLPNIRLMMVPENIRIRAAPGIVNFIKVLVECTRTLLKSFKALVLKIPTSSGYIAS